MAGENEKNQGIAISSIRQDLGQRLSANLHSIGERALSIARSSSIGTRVFLSVLGGGSAFMVAEAPRQVEADQPGECIGYIDRVSATVFENVVGDEHWDVGDRVIGVPEGRMYFASVRGGRMVIPLRINRAGIGEGIREWVPDPRVTGFEVRGPCNPEATNKRGRPAMYVDVKDQSNGDTSHHILAHLTRRQLYEMVNRDRMSGSDGIVKNPNAPIPPPGSERVERSAGVSSQRFDPTTLPPFSQNRPGY
jgi:hypothetical protein